MHEAKKEMLERAKHLDVPLTNRGFLVGCAHIGQMLYDIGCILRSGGTHTDDIGADFHHYLKHILADSRSDEMVRRYRAKKKAAACGNGAPAAQETGNEKATDRRRPLQRRVARTDRGRDR
jgi:hypothetical protein